MIRLFFLQRNDKIIYNHIIFIAEYRCQTISIKQLGCYQQETRGGGQLVGNWSAPWDLKYAAHIRGRGCCIRHLWIPIILDYFGFIGVPFLCLTLTKQGAGDCIPFDGEVDAGAANGASLLPCFSNVNGNLHIASGRTVKDLGWKSMGSWKFIFNLQPILLKTTMIKGSKIGH
jgi:hypothetical protein